MRSWSRSKSLFFGGAFLAAIGSNLKGAENSAPTPVLPGTIEQRDLRMAWWREAKFGMFIHWGPFSVLAGRWKDKNYGDSVFIQRKAKISAGDYAAEGAQFGAGKFDPEAWARLAREAGMRYVVLTAKHHDGFAMWPTKVSEFNIRDHARVNRDPVGELAVACRAQGLKFGLYYSQARDWHHPGGALGGENVKSWDSSLNGDFRSYVEETAMPQVRELLSQYGTIDEFWWDTPNLMTSELAEKFQGLLALQPQIVTNNRLYGRDPRFGGDFETPEQYIPATIKSPMVSGAPGDFDGSVGAGKGASRDFEVCMTMNESWGFTADDHAWKSAENIIRKLVDIASKGGNFLLNIGPDADGRIPQESQDVLREIGGWMKVNGESIYGTTAGPFRYLPWGQATRKSGKLYLHVFDWPTNGKLWVPMIARVTKVCPLGEAWEQARELMGLLSPEERFDLVSSGGAFGIAAVPRLSIPAVAFADASAGLRLKSVASLGTFEKTTAFPCTLLLASTWSGSLAYEYAHALGEEARAGGVHVILGPGANIYRLSQCGRNFEYLGEDPFLSSVMVENYVKGLQSTGVAATLKHFVGNETEMYRRSANSVIDDRALHEIYLPPFQAGIDAGAKCVMTSYNLLNGEWTGQSREAVEGLLRKELGFEWLCMTDWTATWDGEKIAASGVDLEKPSGKSLEKVRAKLLGSSEIDRMATRILATAIAAGFYEGNFARPEWMSRWAQREFVARKVNEQGIVLLQNNGILPLDAASVKGAILVAGINANREELSARGSGHVEG